MRKLTSACFVIIAALTAACAAPLEPTPSAITPQPTAGAPTILELGATPGLGDQGGTAAIGVRVLDPFGTPVANLTIALTSTAGIITPPTVTTDGLGRAAATLKADPGVVTVQAITGSGLTRAIAVAVQPVAPPPPAPTPAPPPTPVPAPMPPPLTVKLLVSPGRAGFPTSFSLATQAITSATWNFGDGGTMTTTEPIADHIYNVSGTYTADVTVTDAKGRTASNAATFTIKP